MRPFLSTSLLCPQLCLSLSCMCAFMRLCQMTSSNQRIYSRGVWGTSGSRFATVGRRARPASYTYNNIQVHSPLPNTHTQTIHGTLNSISLREILHTDECACTFVCSRAEESEWFPKNMEPEFSVGEGRALERHVEGRCSGFALQNPFKNQPCGLQGICFLYCGNLFK